MLAVGVGVDSHKVCVCVCVCVFVGRQSNCRLEANTTDCVHTFWLSPMPGLRNQSIRVPSAMVQSPGFSRQGSAAQGSVAAQSLHTYLYIL